MTPEAQAIVAAGRALRASVTSHKRAERWHRERAKEGATELARIRDFCSAHQIEFVDELHPTQGEEEVPHGQANERHEAHVRQTRA